MDYQAMLALSAPLAVSFAAIGSGLGIGKAVAAAMEAMGRQPEAAAKIQTAMSDKKVNQHFGYIP